MKQNTLVRSLRPVLVGDHIYKDQDADTLAELLIRYWRAIAELWPDAVSSGSRDEYSLMKSVGVLTMHSIAPSVFEAARGIAGKVTQEAIKAVLAPAAKSLPADFWDSREGEAGRVGTNNKAVRVLSDKILPHLRAGGLAATLL